MVETHFEEDYNRKLDREADTPDINNPEEVHSQLSREDRIRRHIKNENQHQLGISIPAGDALSESASKFRGVKEFEGMPFSAHFEPHGPEDWRANQQSALTKWAQAPIKFSTMATTTFLDNTVGFVFGAAEALSGGSFVDNTWSNWMKDIQDSVEDIFPNYATQEEMNRPWYQKLNTANWWTEVIANQGFTAGVVASSALWGGIFTTGAKAIASYKLARGLAGASEGGKLKGLMNSFKSGKISKEQLVKEAQSASKFLQKSEYPIQWLASMQGSMSYARTEALGHARELERSLVEQDSIEWQDERDVLIGELREIGLSETEIKKRVSNVEEERAKNISDIIRSHTNLTFGTGLFYLTVTNQAMFGKLFSGNFKAQQNLAKNLIEPKAGREALKGAPALLKEGVKKGTPEPIRNQVFRHLSKNPMIQFFEESFLHINRESSGDFHRAIFDEEATLSLDGFRDAYMDKMISTFGNIDEWESGMKGFFGGLLGAVGPVNRGGKFKGFAPSGGIWDAITTARQGQATINDRLIDHTNKILSDNKLQTLYQNAVRKGVFEKMADAAITDESKFKYDNAREGEFISDLLTFNEIGLLSEFLDYADTWGNINAETAREMFAVNKDREGNPLETPVDVFEGWTDAQVEKHLKDTSSQFKEFANKMVELKQDLDILAAQRNLSKEVSDEVFFTAASLDNMGRRMKRLREDMPSELITAAENIIDELGVANVTEALEGMFKDNQGKPIKDVQGSFIEALAKKIKEVDATKHKELIIKLNDKIKELTFDSPIKAQVYQRHVEEYVMLNTRMHRFNKFYEALVSDEGAATLQKEFDEAAKKATSKNKAEEAKVKKAEETTIKDKVKEKVTNAYKKAQEVVTGKKKAEVVEEGTTEETTAPLEDFIDEASTEKDISLDTSTATKTEDITPLLKELEGGKDLTEFSPEEQELLNNPSLNNEYTREAVRQEMAEEARKNIGDEGFESTATLFGEKGTDIEAKKENIERRRQQSLKTSLLMGSDGHKYYESNDKINAYYDAEIQALEQREESAAEAQADIGRSVDSKEFKDGDNVDIQETDITLEDKTIDVETNKRHIGSAINYLVSKFKILGSKLGKRTRDYKDVNKQFLSHSQWNELSPGTKLIVSIDTEYNNLTYDFAGDQRILAAEGDLSKSIRTYEQIKTETPIDVPIKIEKIEKGEKVLVGYLPSIAWLNAKDKTDTGTFENLADSQSNPALEEIRKVTTIRNLITSAPVNTQHTFEVTSKGLGYLVKETRIEEGKVVLMSMSEALPSLLESQYFGNTVQPFTIFNNAFLINKSTEFGANIAISEESRLALLESGNGGVFLMIPSSNDNTFIPTPVAAPLLNKAIVEMAVQATIDYKGNPESKLLKDIAFNYGTNINSNQSLKDFLSTFIYFTDSTSVLEEYSDRRPRIAFDTLNSLIYVNFANGTPVKKILLNKKEGLEKAIGNTLREALADKKLSIKLANINSKDAFSIPEVTGTREVTFKESTYNEFLFDEVLTNLRELTSENNVPIYTTQPVIGISPDGAKGITPTTDTKGTTTSLPDGLFNDAFSRFDDAVTDELVGTSPETSVDELISAEQQAEMKELSQGLLISDGDFIFGAAKQGIITSTISTLVYDIFLESYRDGKPLSVKAAFEFAKSALESRLKSIEYVVGLGEDKANELINTNSKVASLRNYNNAVIALEDLQRAVKGDVWSQFEAQVINNLAVLGVKVENNSVKDFSLQELQSQYEAMVEEIVETNEGLIEKSWDDFAVFQMDAKDSARWTTKLFLSKIKNGESNYLGIKEFLPFDTVFDDLLNILSTVTGDIELFITRLKEVSTDNPAKNYLKYVIQELESSNLPVSVKNNLVSVMQSANNKFKLTLWKRGDDGWTVNVIDSNRYNVINRILEGWNEGFKLSSLIKEVGGKLELDKAEVSTLVTRFKGVDPSNKEQRDSFVKDLFNALGISLPQKALENLLTKDLNSLGGKPFNIKGNIENQFSVTRDGKPNGLISFIVNSLFTENTGNLEGNDVDSFSINNPFVGENSEKALKFLASLAATYGLTTDTNTFRSVENKTIYQYSYYLPETFRINKLNTDKSTREAVRKTPVGEFMRYLDLLEQGSELIFELVDGLKQTGNDRSGVVRPDMSSREQLFLALSHFQKDPNKPGYLGLTHSDKSVSPITSMDKLKFDISIGKDFTGEVKVEHLPKLVRNEIQKLIKAELARIEFVRRGKADGTITAETHGNQYYNGAEYFYIFPKLNSLLESADTATDIKLMLDIALQDVVDAINDTTDRLFEEGFVYNSNNKWRTAFKTSYLNNKGLKNIHDTEADARVVAAKLSSDMNVNYFIHNANMMFLVHGDPALLYKSKNTVDESIAQTLADYEKRLAKDSAPGAMGHYNWELKGKNGTYRGKSKYNVVFANDITHGTLTDGYIRNIEAYMGNIDRTDAQEYTTVAEHLNLLMSYGKIADNVFTTLMDKITSSKGKYYEFSEEEMSVILQPMKPVQVVHSIDPVTGVEQIYYIKSSSFPLLPQLTQGFGLDALRASMETQEIDRVVFKTAAKIGHKKLVSLADVDGSFMENYDFSDKGVSLNREGFTIQQEIPYDKTKTSILTISQMNKLLFEGIADIKFNVGGAEFTGAQLKAQKEAIRGKLFELSAGELYQRMGIGKNAVGEPVIQDYRKLFLSITEEATKRGWPVNDVASITIDKDGNFRIPIAFNNSAERIESLLLSMFTNSIIKQDVSGKSLVQGTSEGLRNNVKTLDEITETSSIIWVKDKFNPAKGLTYTHLSDDGSEFIGRAQVILPWKFQGKLAQFIKVNENSTKYLDTAKIPKEVLNIIGARIPNQGHSSQIALEIVGFLPENMGDLVLVPGEITKQMGSDFDVDKLYTYFYNTIVNSDGNLKIIPQLLDGDLNLDDAKYHDFISKNFKQAIINRISLKQFREDIKKYLPESNLTSLKDMNAKEVKLFLSKIKEENPSLYNTIMAIEEGILKQTLDLRKEDLNIPSKKELIRKVLENMYIKIHDVVLTHPEIAKKSMRPLDNKDLTITGNVGNPAKEKLNYLTLPRQIDNFSDQKEGKALTGIFSRAVVGAVVMQDFDIKLGVYNDKGEVVETPFKRFGEEKTTEGKLAPYQLVKLSRKGESYFNGLVKEKYFRSVIDNLVTQQSASVDNANKQELHTNNLNELTSNASIALSMLRDNNGLSLDVTYNSYLLRQEIIKEFVKEMSNLSDTFNEDYVEDRKQEIVNKLTLKYLERIGEKEYEKTDKVFSRNDLLNLLKSENVNSADYVRDQIELLDVFINLDTIGQEISEIFTAISLDSKGMGKSYWESSLKQQRLENLENKSLIVGAEQITQNTEIGELGNYLAEANKIMQDIFPYTAEKTSKIIGTVEAYTGRQGAKASIALREAVWREMKRFSFTNTMSGLFNKTREELFAGENSLARRTIKMKESSEGARNLFIKRTNTILSTDGNTPDQVTYSAAVAQRTDEADIIKAFTDLFMSTNPETREYAEDLVAYAYMGGGIQQALEFIKYVPTAYLLTTSFGKSLFSIEGALKGDTSLFNESLFLRQFFQHNPHYAKKLITKTAPKKEGFQLDVETNSNMNVEYLTPDGTPVAEFPDYISYRNAKSNEWWLYELVGQDEANSNKFNYTRMNLLGGRGKNLTAYNEYNFSNDVNTSLVDKNNIKNDVPTAQVKERKENLPEINPKEKTVASNPIASEVRTQSYFSNKTGKESVEHLANSAKTERIKSLLNHLVSLDYLPTTLTIKADNNLVSKNTDRPSRGKYIPDTKEVIINPKIIAQHEKAAGREFTFEAIESALAHELIHGYTSDLYNTYQKDLQTNIQTLPKEVVSSLRRIEVLRNMAVKQFTPDQLVEYIRLKSALETKDQAFLETHENTQLIDKYYGFLNPKEFIAEAFSNPLFQEQLNNMTVTKDSPQTVFERFIELVKSLFMGVKKNSILEAALHESLNLMSTYNADIAQELRISPQPVNESITQESQVFEQFGTYYKFAVDVFGIPIEGYYSQGNTKNWNTLASNKVDSKYKELLQAEDASTREQEAMLKPNEPVLKTNEKHSFTYKGKTIGTEFQLGNDQTKALEILIDFINSSEGIYTLEGAAGTGKTAVIGYLQKYFGGGVKFVYSAPTHAATAELAFATVKTGNNKLPFTIQSSVRLNPRTERYSFTAKVNKLLGLKSVLVVDEASMTDATDVFKLKQAAEESGVKLIFMGDVKQIPKVTIGKDATKPVANAFTDFKKVTMNEIFRQTENTLLSILSAIRNHTGEFKLFKSKNTDAVKFVTKSEFNRELIEDLRNDPEGTTVISYTNASVKATNVMVREQLGRVGQTVPGDILIGYLGYASKQIERGDIANSISYTITEISELNGGMYIETVSKKLQNLSDKGIEIPVKGTTIYYQLSKEDSLTFDSLGEAEYKENNSIVSKYFKTIHTANENYKSKLISYPSYLSILEGISQDLAKVSVGNDYIYNPSTEMMEKYDSFRHSKLKKDGQGSLLFNKDVDYGHAITIHKSQGTTINNVYFNAESLGAAPLTKIVDKKGNVVTTERQALGYVALSRAKNKLRVYEGATPFYDISEGKVDALIGFTNKDSSLGTSVGNFMKTLNKAERLLLRQFMERKEIKFKCY